MRSPGLFAVLGLAASSCDVLQWGVHPHLVADVPGPSSVLRSRVSDAIADANDTVHVQLQQQELVRAHLWPTGAERSPRATAAHPGTVGSFERQRRRFQRLGAEICDAIAEPSELRPSCLDRALVKGQLRPLCRGVVPVVYALLLEW